MPLSVLKLWKKLLYHLKPLKNIPRWTKEQKVQLASYMDCDGSISISYLHKGQAISPAINFTNTSKELTEYVKAIAQMGSIYEKRKNHPTHKKIYEWHILSFNEILLLLKNIEPYLIGRRRQAILVIEFIESRINRGIKENLHVQYSKREREIAEEVRKLNK